MLKNIVPNATTIKIRTHKDPSDLCFISIPRFTDHSVRSCGRYQGLVSGQKFAYQFKFLPHLVTSSSVIMESHIIRRNFNGRVNIWVLIFNINKLRASSIANPMKCSNMPSDTVDHSSSS